MPEPSPITALLGPTNTGKTHRAIERMLEHDSGMIGLPLRLLAREVYDRITTRIGEGRVALVTGEEKRVPRRPDYWVCTVEAMPMDREVDFLAVDEIQLAAHEERGHVFTERLLRARGRRETWFMGAETMRPLVGELLPTARFAAHPRLSRLASAGASPLGRMPPRSAVVAFSTTQVYEIAERLKSLKGGAAVVLGALSPRTRNAQVALFQSGEVDYLVATDAIGMGLNLDVGHVAFAALRKFDGREVRELEAAELGQIAGRAGRYLADGTFGTVAPLSLPDPVTRAIEAHRFPVVRRLLWRNDDLDRSSIDALIASLKERPRMRCLKLVQEPEDTAALVRLSQDPAIRARAQGEEAVKLFWQVCQIPDFRKLLLESHLGLLADIFTQLTGPKGVLDPDWMAARVGELDDTKGDIETLIARIASIRTFTYISHHARWIHGASAWQERTREVEDRLSDALHERLVQRFVETSRGKRGPAPKPRANKPRAHEPLPEIKASHPFARLEALRSALAPGPEAPSRDTDRWVESIVSARHHRFSVDLEGRITFDAQQGEDEKNPLGRLVRGTSLLLPEVRLMGLDKLGAGARARILRRLVAFARDLVEELLAPLRGPKLRELSAAGRGVVYQLEQGLGTATAREARAQLDELSPRDREIFEALGVVVGEHVVYVTGLLRRPAIEQRYALCAAYFEGRSRAPCPRPAAVSVVAERRVDARMYTAIGYPVFGTRAIRADVVERVHKALSEGAEGEEGGPNSGRLASWIGCPAREVQGITEALTSA